MLYLDDGKGLDAGEPEKRAFFRFWEIAWLKRFKLIGVNLIYFVCNLIPTVIAAAGYLLAVSFYFTLATNQTVTEAIASAKSPQAAQNMYWMGLVFVTVLFNIIPVFSAGPCRAGLTFVTKSFAKREPVFVWTDFWAKTRSNLRLSVITMIINAVVGVLIMVASAFYLACSAPKSALYGFLPGWFRLIAFGAILFCTIMFLSMNMYIYPMIVTFRLTVKQLYKNAIIFAFIKWLPNLGILLLTGAMVAIPLLFVDGYFAFIISLALYAFIGIAFTSFLHTFYVYPILKKYMIDNLNADKSEEGERRRQEAEEAKAAEASDTEEQGE